MAGFSQRNTRLLAAVRKQVERRRNSLPAVQSTPSLVDRRHLAKTFRAHVDVIFSVLLATALLAVVLLASKGLELLAGWLWDEPDGPPIDISFVRTATGIIGTVGIVGHSAIDTLVTLRRAIQQGGDQ